MDAYGVLVKPSYIDEKKKRRGGESGGVIWACTLVCANGMEQLVVGMVCQSIGVVRDIVGHNTCALYLHEEQVRLFGE